LAIVDKLKSILIPLFKEGKIFNLGKFCKKFSVHFKEQLKKRYKIVPSTNFIANEFNLRAHDSSTVSREAARKWLNGLSFPKSDKLSVMRKWLDIETDLFDKD
jgi:hypothetical protein